jgi:hypothetical protein
MKTSHKVIVAASAIVGAFGLLAPLGAFAATTPSLGQATGYAVLSSTYTNTTPTTVNGGVGFTTGPAVAPTGVQTNFGPAFPYATAGTDQNAALSALASQACTFTFAPGAIDLSADLTHGGPMGVYTPGVYCTTGAASIGTGGIMLSGAGTYVFRINGALNTAANSAVTLSGGASPSDVFFTPSAATTLGANSSFIGNILDTAGITIGSTVNLVGRALAFGGTVTTNADVINLPSVAVVPVPVVVPAPVPAPTTVTTVTPTAVTTVTTTTGTPPLPNAGYGPDENSSTPWNVIIPALLLIVLLAYYQFGRKRSI